MRVAGEDAGVEDVPARLDEVHALPVQQHHQLQRERLSACVGVRVCVRVCDGSRRDGSSSTSSSLNDCSAT